MVKDLVIVGGGTAGWLTAGYLARMLSADRLGGINICVIESADIGILGVGEGTFPSIQRMLHRLGIDETTFVRECNATFKQGIRFDNWRRPPAHGEVDRYLHPFAMLNEAGDLDLTPYWLLGCAGDVPFDVACTVQKRVADASRAPKRIGDRDFDAPLTYAYHFDAIAFARLLRTTAVKLGVKHIVDTVEEVNVSESGAITSVTTREHGEVKGDLFIDCSGFRARLIGQALKSPFRSRRDALFCDRAVAMQVPYERADAPIASYTISTAQEAGWTWDIGLDARRGIGHVYSSAHMDDDRAEEILRGYIGPAAENHTVRTFQFEAGYREASWVKNCVAIGLAGGFFEPLEATGIVLIEVAAVLLANLFPWSGQVETAAKQFNQIMAKRYDCAVDFLKMHYCLTQRTDTSFWRDNREPKTIPDTLKELLDRWTWRPPSAVDFDPNITTFQHSSWQFVLYGMGFKTDLSARAGALRYHDEAREAFATIRRQAEVAVSGLPSHRDLITHIHRHGNGAPRGSGMNFTATRP